MFSYFISGLHWDMVGIYWESIYRVFFTKKKTRRKKHLNTTRLNCFYWCIHHYRRWDTEIRTNLKVRQFLLAICFFFGFVVCFFSFLLRICLAARVFAKVRGLVLIAQDSHSDRGYARFLLRSAVLSRDGRCTGGVGFDRHERTRCYRLAVGISWLSRRQGRWPKHRR